MNANLERYINDHLAGSAGAVDLIAAIGSANDDPTHQAFFAELGSKVEEDRTILKDLLKRVGTTDSKALQMTGTLTAKASRLKLMWEGLEPGKLGMLEALEILCLGIQGKRLLWRVLSEIAPFAPAWSDVDFEALEQEAVQQRNAVETYRLRAGVAAFT